MNCVDIWNSIIERAGNKLRDLSPTERIIYRVNRFCVDSMQNGWTGYTYNVSPSQSGQPWSELRADADAVESVGKRECADAMRNAAELLEGISAGTGPTWGEFLAPVEARLEAELQTIIDASLPEVWEKLEEFTLQSFGDSQGAFRT